MSFYNNRESTGVGTPVFSKPEFLGHHTAAVTKGPQGSHRYEMKAMVQGLGGFVGLARDWRDEGRGRQQRRGAAGSFSGQVLAAPRHPVWSLWVWRGREQPRPLPFPPPTIDMSTQQPQLTGQLCTPDEVRSCPPQGSQGPVPSCPPPYPPGWPYPTPTMAFLSQAADSPVLTHEFHGGSFSFAHHQSQEFITA